MWLQACAPVERGGPWCPTFALRWLENLSFFFSYKYTGCHGFHSFRALGSLQFSLEDSLGINEIKTKLNSRQCWSAASCMWFSGMHLWLHRGFWVFTAFSLWPSHYAGIVVGYSCSFRFLTCLIVTAGLQSFSSSRRDKHTVPDGYTLGWKIGGSNLPEKVKDTLFIKPSFPNHFTLKQFVIWYNNKYCLTTCIYHNQYLKYIKFNFL